VLLHIPGINNPSDDLTKALGWLLHSRHSRRLMGHIRPRFHSPVPAVSDPWRPTSPLRLDSLNREPVASRSGEGVNYPMSWTPSPRLLGP
jgi:hypothetical protein